MNRFIRSRLSETARSLLWLWENDPKGWRIGGYAVAHPSAQVGVWIANSVYGLHAAYDVPKYGADRGSISLGMEVKLKWLDRKMLYRAMRRPTTPRRGGHIPFAISEWAMRDDRFAEKVSVPSK